MPQLMNTVSFSTGRNPLTQAGCRLALLFAGALLLVATSGPAFAQRCTTQNGETICCDNSGNCYSK
jgi:hypothetical protein